MAVQGMFRHKADFIVVRPIRMSSKITLEPGTELKFGEHGIRRFHLQSLFKRRRIGLLGSTWAQIMLEQPNNAHTRPELTIEDDTSHVEIDLDLSSLDNVVLESAKTK